jgi:hypothetical protein
MKKIIYCFVAALALVACTPKNGADQVIRIGVSLDNDAQPNQKAQQRISAEDKGSVIKILWEDKDVLYYQLEGKGIDKDNPFKLISGAGTKNAFFETTSGELASNTFTLYYNGAGNPGGEIPTSQNNEANTVNDDYLFYTATNCKLESVIKLEPKFALLGVQLVSDQNDNSAIQNFTENLVIGNSINSNGFIYELNVAYLCTHEDPVDLLYGAATFYFVLPEGYSLSGKYIGLAAATGAKHYTSKALQLPNITLDANQANIITINVHRTNEQISTGFYYEISKSTSSN